VFWGYQLGASYEINDMLSVYLGARYVTANNTYAGHLTDVNITLGGTETSAAGFFTNSANAIQPLYEGLAGLSAGGAGALTLDQALALTIIDAPTYAALAGGYAMFGLDPAVNTIDQGSSTVSPSYLGARRAEHVLADQDNVEVEQSGSGITPIIGVNISPNDKLNIGIKYEFMTKIELENNTTKDFITNYDYLTGIETGMFPNGEINRNDMPALLTVGVDYKMSDKFLVSTGIHYYFDKSANYGYKKNNIAVENSDAFDSNYLEWALGLEYNISDKMLVSAGYLFAKSGLKAEFQTDLNYKISSHSIGLGGAYSITPKIDLNIAAAYSFYTEDDKIYDYNVAGGPVVETITETYNRSNLFFGLGLDFKFGKTSE
jgi:long-chain fatty acid transport protein